MLSKPGRELKRNPKLQRGGSRIVALRVREVYGESIPQSANANGYYAAPSTPSIVPITRTKFKCRTKRPLCADGGFLYRLLAAEWLAVDQIGIHGEL